MRHLGYASKATGVLQQSKLYERWEEKFWYTLQCAVLNK